MKSPTRVEKKLIHYVKKAMHDYRMLDRGDRIMVCLSGGKDSYTLLNILNIIRTQSNYQFDLFAFTLDQAQPGWNDAGLRQWLESRHIPYEILTRDTYSIVKEKIPEGKTYCSLCSRLRRGIVYRYAKENGFKKIALGHHRDDLIQTLLMSMLYSGQIRSMPPKLLTDDKAHLVIRPLVYCQEKDIIEYLKEQEFPIIPCNLCGSQENLMRKQMKQWIAQLAMNNPKVPSNLLRALSNVKPSQLMDHRWWNFRELDTDAEWLKEAPALVEEEDPF
jgi:tRNA 2-thiocytidine biosynthesis protein TtcA